MGFDLTKGRLDESTHPFCRGILLVNEELKEEKKEARI